MAAGCRGSAVGEDKQGSLVVIDLVPPGAQWGPVLGGIFGIIVLICLGVCVWSVTQSHSVGCLACCFCSNVSFLQVFKVQTKN